MNNTIQFKRILSSNKNLSDTIVAIKNNLNPPLEDGEPLICSYLEGGLKRFLLAIGTPSDPDNPIRILPTFRNEQEIYAYANGGINLKDQISTDSDFSVIEENGKLKFIIKDDLKNI